MAACTRCGTDVILEDKKQCPKCRNVTTPPNPPIKKWQEQDWEAEKRRRGIPEEVWIKPAERDGFFPDDYLA